MAGGGGGAGGGGVGGGVGGGSDGRLGFLSGHVLGTPSHLAPEAFLPGNVLDASVDMYRWGRVPGRLCTAVVQW